MEKLKFSSRIRIAEELVLKTLEKVRFRCSELRPVPVETIASYFGLEVRRMKGNASLAGIDGFLSSKGRNSGVIFVFPSSKYRARFTVAHELGHFLLKQFYPNLKVSDEDIEKICDEYSSRLLLPSAFIKICFTSSLLSLKMIEKMSRKLEISIPLILKRLRDAAFEELIYPSNGAFYIILSDHKPKILTYCLPKGLSIPTRELSELGMDILAYIFREFDPYTSGAVTDKIVIKDGDQTSPRYLAFRYKLLYTTRDDTKKSSFLFATPRCPRVKAMLAVCEDLTKK